MSELTVQFENGETAIAVVRDYYVDFEGSFPSIRLDMTQNAVDTIKRTWPTAWIWKGDRRLA
jgi:hypothetical protein